MLSAMGFQTTLSRRRTDIIVWSVLAVVMILVTVGIVCLTKAGSTGSSSTGTDLTVRQPDEETSLQPEAAGADGAGSTGANDGEESPAVSPAPPAPSPPPPPPPPRDPTSRWQDRSRAFNFPGQAKRGICWTFSDTEKGDAPMNPFDRISWTYNWHSMARVSSLDYYGEQGIEFVPMQWNGWGIENLADNIPRDAEHLLAFNEPNHAKQAKMWPSEAARLWPKLVKVKKERNLRLSSPTVSPCGGKDEIYSKYADPFAWMDDWHTNCPDCKFDFVSTHYYSCNLEWTKSYLLKWYKRYNMKVWLTEFACPFGDEATAGKYLKAFIEWADRQPWIERYAWYTLDLSDPQYFWLGQGNRLLNYNELQLTELGRTYNSYQAKDGVSTASVNGTAANSGEDENGDIPDWEEICGHCARLSSSSSKEDQDYCTFECGFISRVKRS